VTVHVVCTVCPGATCGNDDGVVAVAVQPEGPFSVSRTLRSVAWPVFGNVVVAVSVPPGVVIAGAG
jgi:hypothetical protein